MDLEFTIKRRTTTLNSFNAEIETYVPHLTIYGNLDLLTGNTTIKYGKNNESSTHLLICDVCDIQENDKIYFKNKIFKVNFVDNPMELDDHLEIELELVVTDNE